MLVEIRKQAFDPWQEINRYQENSRLTAGLTAGSYGACAAFVGTLRDFNQGDKVKRLQLTHYQGMTEHQLRKIAEQALSQYRLLDLIIIHRVGDINPNEPIVLVATWSVHRAAAFDSCREIMEYLKSKATFWKQEIIESGQPEQPEHQREQKRWVEQ